MTPPPEGGFSLSRSFAKGQPGPEYVRGADDVRMPSEVAGDAGEVGLGDTVLLGAVPTLGAGAGGVGGVHRNDDTTGAFSLGVQHVEEHPPTRI